MEEIPEGELHQGLRAAFNGGARSGEDDHSVLARLERDGKPVRRVLLRDLDEESSPLLKPRGGREARYQVVGEIARGGVGVVLKGRDVDLGRDVAMKVLLENHDGNAEIVQRFVEEAQIGGQLQHPGIVPIYEMGLTETERPYFTMKLVKGETLAVRLRDHDRSLQGLRSLLAIFERICDAVGYAHSRGVVHRDLKPANIIVGAYGEVQVVDWGLAKVLGREDTAAARRPAQTVVSTVRSEGGSQSMVGSIFGTPAYMPPEQALGQVDSLDRRSDVFALGALLCEILTGKPPYLGTTPVEQVLQARRCDMTEVAERLGNEPLAPLTLECLAAAQSDRPDDGRVVAERIRAHLASIEDRARTARVAAAKEEARGVEERRAKRVLMAIYSTALAAVLLGGGALAWTGHQSQSRATAAADKVRPEIERAQLARGSGNWVEAVGAAQSASALAFAEGADADLRDEADQLRRTVQNESRQAAEDADARAEEQAFLQLLDDAVARSGDDFDALDADREYEQIFDDFGSLDDRPTAFLQTVGDHLDRWASIRLRHLPRADAAILFQRAEKVAPGPLRSAMRTAVLDEDLDAVERLAREALAHEGADATGPVRLAGRMLQHSGRLSAALDVFRSLQERDPSDFWSHHFLARILAELDDSDGAGRHYTAALALRERSVQTRAALASLETDLEKRIAILEDALRVAPEWAEGWVELALARESIGDTPGAQRNVERALELTDDDHRVVSAMGELWLLQGRREPELAARKLAHSLAPDNPAYMVALARARFDAGERGAAIDLARRAVEMRPGSAAAWSGLGTLLRRRGNLVAAADAYRRVLEINPTDTFAYRDLERIAPDEANGKSLAKALEAFPESARLHYVKGVRLAAANDEAGATQAYERAIELNPAVYASAYIYLSERRSFQDAVELLRQALVHRPQSSRLFAQLGRRYRSEGMRSKAAAVLRQAVKFGSANRSYHDELMPFVPEGQRLALLEADVARRGESWSRAWCIGEYWRWYGKHPQRAETAYRRAIELDPSRSGWAYRSLSVLLLSESRPPAEATAVARAGLEHLGRDRGLHFALANSRRDEGKTDEAIESYRRTIELDPGHLDAYAELMDLLPRDEALAIVTDALRSDPASPGLHHMVGYYWQYHGEDHEKAKEAYLRALDIAPRENQYTYSNLVEMLSPEDALPVLQKGVEQLPLESELRLRYAACLERNGKTDEAIEEYLRTLALDGPHSQAHHAFMKLVPVDRLREFLEEAVRRSPLSACAHHQLGIYWRDRGEDIEKARDFWRAAIKLNPRAEPNAIVFLARSFEEEEPEKTISVLRDALEALPGNAGIEWTLASTLIRHKEYKEAETLLRAVIKRAPGRGPGYHQLLASCLPDKEAIVALERAVREFGHEAEAHLWYELGKRFARVGELERANAALTTSIDIVTAELEVAADRAATRRQGTRILYSRSTLQRLLVDVFSVARDATLWDNDTAIALLQKATAVSPETAQVSLSLGLKLLTRRDVDEGLAAIRRGLSSADARDAETLDYMSAWWALIESSPTDALREQFDAEVPRLPESRKLRWAHGYFLARQGAHEEARAELLAGLRIMEETFLDGDPRGHLYLANGWLNRPETIDESFFVTRLGLERFPDSHELHAHLAALHFSVGDQEAAEIAFQRALELNPQPTVWDRRSGRLLYSRGEAAPAELRDELARARATKDSWAELALALDLAGTLPESGERQALVERALDIAEGDPLRLQWASLALHRIGRHDAAKQAFAALQDLENDPKAARQVALLRALSPYPEFRDAEQALDRARELADKYSAPWFQGLLGIARYRNQEFAQAVISLENARPRFRVTEDGDQFVIQAFLAMAYWKTGQEERARETLALSRDVALRLAEANALVQLAFAEAKELIQ